MQALGWHSDEDLSIVSIIMVLNGRLEFLAI